MYRLSIRNRRVAVIPVGTVGGSDRPRAADQCRRPIYYEAVVPDRANPLSVRAVVILVLCRFATSSSRGGRRRIPALTRRNRTAPRSSGEANAPYLLRRLPANCRRLLQSRYVIAISC